MFAASEIFPKMDRTAATDTRHTSLWRLRRLSGLCHCPFT